MLAASAAASAQSVQVYSEFTRVDPFGNIVRADRGDPPREILSPALPRNAISAFHLVVAGPTGTSYTLYVGQNPENATEARLYREKYQQVGDEWVPDAVEAVPLPYEGRLETEGIPNQTAQSFWLDLRVDREAEVQRIKIEPQVSFADRWVRYPMEARVVMTTAPYLARPSGIALPAVAQPADYAARRVLKQKLCGNSEKVPAQSTLTIRNLIARDAAQDVAMASVVPSETLWEIIGARDRAEWCRTDLPHAPGPEWYLRIRDRVVGARRQ